MSTALYLVAAALLLTLGHVFKTIRWRSFVSQYENTSLPTLMNSLAAGYLVNFVLPFRLGDLLRAVLAGRRMRNGVGYAIATVLVDRSLDVLCVTVMFLAGAGLTGLPAYRQASLIYVLLTAALAAGFAAVLLFRRPCKKLALAFCSLFNERIKFRLLLFAWSLNLSFRDLVQRIKLWRLLLQTLLMWGAYLGSYALVAQMLRQSGTASSFADVFLQMFRTDALLHSTFAATGDSGLLLALYCLLPLLILLLVSFLLRRRSPKAPAHPLLPQMDPAEQLQFLNVYFEGDSREAMQEFLTMNQDVSIMRNCSAGSDATTMLCLKQDCTVYRKYAFGAVPAGRLISQADWLRANSGLLPLPEIVAERRGKLSYCYDMGYDQTAIGFFEYIHTVPAARSREMLLQILTQLRQSLYAGAREPVSPEALERYLDRKVQANLQAVSQSGVLRQLAEAPTLQINGQSCLGLPRLLPMLEKGHLLEIFAGDLNSPCHGDLTVENIICYPDGSGYYLIDPNPDGPLQTQMLDYAKLLQSLHGGYEFLEQSRLLSVEGGTVNLLLPDSGRYAALHGTLRDWLREQLGEAGLRSAYYHEIIHWLRLMPYRLRKDERGAVRYFAGMLLVMNDVYRRYEEAT